MNQFLFSGTPELIFGPGSLWKVAARLPQFGAKGLIVTGKSSFRNSVHFKKLALQLKENQLEFECVEVEYEPTFNFIDNTCNLLVNNKLKWVVAIGGGAVMDAGKAISAMIPLNESILPFLEGSEGFKRYSGSKLPFIAVPTTAGTGSEATKNAVISGAGNIGFKRSLRHDTLIPNLAIIDPELHISCPAHITASSGLDALTQLIESYVSTQASPITDILAFEGIKHIIHALPVAYKEPENIEARSQMAYAAHLSGITLANAGLGTVHGFASSVGGVASVPHGTICGTMMGVVNKFTIRKLLEQSNNSIAIEKYAKIGKLFEAENKNTNMHSFAIKAGEQLCKLVELLSIPKLSELGISKEQLPGIATKTGNKYNPVQFNASEIEQMLLERF